MSGDEVDSLFELPPEDFVDARDELARRLEERPFHHGGHGGDTEGS